MWTPDCRPTFAAARAPGSQGRAGRPSPPSKTSQDQPAGMDFGDSSMEAIPGFAGLGLASGSTGDEAEADGAADPGPAPQPASNNTGPARHPAARSARVERKRRMVAVSA